MAFFTQKGPAKPTYRYSPTNMLWATGFLRTRQRSQPHRQVAWTEGWRRGFSDDGPLPQVICLVGGKISNPYDGSGYRLGGWGRSATMQCLWEPTAPFPPVCVRPKSTSPSRFVIFCTHIIDTGRYHDGRGLGMRDVQDGDPESLRGTHALGRAMVRSSPFLSLGFSRLFVSFFFPRIHAGRNCVRLFIGLVERRGTRKKREGGGRKGAGPWKHRRLEHTSPPPQRPSSVPSTSLG